MRPLFARSFPAVQSNGFAQAVGVAAQRPFGLAIGVGFGIGGAADRPMLPGKLVVGTDTQETRNEPRALPVTLNATWLFPLHIRRYLCVQKHWKIMRPWVALS